MAPNSMTVIPGGHAAAANRVLQGLDDAVGLGKAGKDDEALVRLQGLKPDAADLRAASRDMNAMMKSEEDFAESRLREALEALATARETDARLREQIEPVRAESEADEARLREASEQLDAYRNEMNRLQEKLRDLADELEDHQSDLRKWGWVPGYGAYLAIENISDMIQGKQGELDAAARSYQDVSGRMPGLEDEARRVASKRDALLAQLQVLTDRENEVQDHMDLLEWFQKAQSGVVAASAVGASFYAGLDVSLQNVEDDLESVYDLAGRLSETVEVVDEGMLRPGTLREALLQLADHADASTRIVICSTGSYSPDPGEPAGMPINIADRRFNLFVPFTVKQVCHFKGVGLPISGTDLRVELATGPALPEASADEPRPFIIDPPTVLASRQLPGETPPGAQDIAFSETVMLLPGERYFIIIWPPDSQVASGNWMIDKGSVLEFGYLDAYREDWLIFPYGHGEGTPVVEVYGTLALDATILEALSPVPRPPSPDLHQRRVGC